MRKAAGIILIILGMFLLVVMIIDAIGLITLEVHPSSFRELLWHVLSNGVVWGGLLVAGGVLCLKRRYWGLCLVSALFTLMLTIIPVVGTVLSGSLSLLTDWRTLIMVVGTLISTILIFLTKYEWEEISD